MSGAIIASEPDNVAASDKPTFVEPTRRPEVLPEAKRGFLSNAPDDSWLSSAAKGAGTVLGKAVAAVPGLPGDIAGLLDYATTGVQSYIQDKPHASLLKQRAEEVAKKQAEGQWQFPTSDELYRRGADALGLGEYKATSTPGKYLMIGGEGAASMLGPFGVLGKGAQAAKAATTAGKSTAAGLGVGARTMLPGVALGATAPVVGHAASEATGSPGMGLVAGLATPFAIPTVKGGYNLLRDPVRGARSQVLGGMNDRKTVSELLAGREDTSSYGSPRMTAEAYPNDWLAAKQIELLNSKNATDANTARMMRVRQGQRSATEGALNQIAGEAADPLAVSRAAEQTQQQLQAEVSRLNRAASTATDPVEAANLQRQLAVAERKLHDKDVNTLYRSVDPDGVAQVPLAGVKGTAERMMRNHDPLASGEMAPELSRLLTDIRNPDLAAVSPYQRALALDQRIEDARRSAIMAGDDGLARQIGELKTSIMSDLEKVQLPPTSAAAGVTPAETLRAAKDKYIEGLQRFENPYVESALAGKGYGRFNMVPEDVANRIFVAGDKGANAVASWLETAGGKPEGLRNIQDIALARLNKERLGANARPEPLTQEMLDAWKKRYGSALTAIDNVAPGFSTQFDNAAVANARLGEFAQSQLGRFLGITEPKEVQNRVAMMLGADSGPRQIREMLAQVPEVERGAVLDGLRRAGATGIINNFTNPQTGAVQGVAFAKYLRKNEAALRELYGDNFNNLEAIAAEMARIEAVAAAGMKRGSPTGYNTRKQLDSPPGHDPTLMETVMTGAMLHPVTGPGGAAAITAYTTGKRIWHFLEKARNQTMNEIIADAIFDPVQMRALLGGTYKLAGQPTSMVDSLKALGWNQKAMQLTPNVNVPARAALQGARESQSALERREQERRARGEAAGGPVRARKAGGRIGRLDHGSIAMSLIRAAEKAKKGHNTTTEPLLEQPDEAITKALAIADEALS
jgi:hypothetical protein